MVFLLHKILLSIKDFMYPGIFILIILVSIFEFFVDRPALKSEGLMRDAKITAFVSIGWIVLDVIMAVINIMVR